jgi:tetratricopeptide (TPR) repeat protein
MKKLSFTIALVFQLVVGAANTEETFASGNKLYTEQNYSEALVQYHSLADSGYVSSALFFNMGNAYYRLNQLGNAILYYEKAKAIDPDNKDILANLAIADAGKIDKFETVPTPALTRIWNSVIGLFSASTWLTIALVFIFGGASFLTLFLVNKNKSTVKFSAYVALGALGLFFLFIGKMKQDQMQNNIYGVLVTSNAYVKSEPNGGQDLFIVHEGSKAKIEETFQDWIKVRFSDGKSGWLSSSEFTAI